MKIKILFAITCAVLTACSVSDIDTVALTTDGTAFVEGQRVILTIGSGQGTKATGTLNTLTDAIQFKWEEGDQIKVTVGESSAPFTLKTGAGEVTATFEGEMPGDGTTFSVQYPNSGLAESDLANQTYSSTAAIPRDRMLARAEGCTLDEPFVLDPQYAVLRLNLWGSMTIGKIVVTNTTSSASTKPTYTLSCKDGVDVSSSTTPFFIVVPAGETNWNFRATVFDTSETCICTLDKTSTGEYFDKAKVLNMPAPPIYSEASTLMPSMISGTWWAPVNCGYDATDYPYGLLYQFGRKEGGGYNDGTEVYQAKARAFENYDSDGYNKQPNSGKFYYTFYSPYDWYTNSSPKQLSSWPMKEGDSGYIEGKISNPCPKDWRVPTYEELNSLFGNNKYPTLRTVGGMNGFYFNGTSGNPDNGVFLHAAGGIAYNSGTSGGRGQEIFYWSSSPTGSNAYILSYQSIASVSGIQRAKGASVRCVHE